MPNSPVDCRFMVYMIIENCQSENEGVMVPAFKKSENFSKAKKQFERAETA